MAAVKPPEERSLKELLDGLQLSQRRDIKAYSGGHLNEANLWKPPEKISHKSWKSAKKDNITVVPRNRILQVRDHIIRQSEKTYNSSVQHFLFLINSPSTV